jgi:hypothetical protein
MSGVTGFEDLIVWQRSMSLVREVYRLTGSFPADERFGLTSQIRRALSPFRRTLLKAMSATPPASTFDSFQWLKGLLQKFEHNS